MKKFFSVVFGLFAMCFSMFASAVSQFDPLTTGINFTEVITAILAVAVIGIGYIMATGGAVKIMGFVQRVMHRG